VYRAAAAAASVFDVLVNLVPVQLLVCLSECLCPSVCVLVRLSMQGTVGQSL